jgi:AmiR/NasT family two-component response regulator
VASSCDDLAGVEIASLKEALTTRTTIGEAVGLLMHEKTLTADAAFAHLVEVSSRTNVKIREIAAQMVEEADARAERADVGVQAQPWAPPEPRNPRCAMS